MKNLILTAAVICSLTLNLVGDKYTDCLDLVIGLQKLTNSLHLEKANLSNRFQLSSQMMQISNRMKIVQYREKQMTKSTILIIAILGSFTAGIISGFKLSK